MRYTFTLALFSFTKGIIFFCASVFFMLSGCNVRPNFNKPSVGSPDTANYYTINQSVGYIDPQLPAEERGRILWNRLRHYMKWNGNVTLNDFIWKPYSKEGAYDTLWVRTQQRSSDVYFCAYFEPLINDFSKRNDEKLDTATYTTAVTITLSDSINRKTPAERGCWMAQKLFDISTSLFVSSPHQMVWLPSSGTDDDSLWLVSSEKYFAFCVVIPRHPLPSDSIWNEERFTKDVIYHFPCDTADIIEHKSIWTKFTYPKSDKLRPIAYYIPLSSILLLAVLIYGGLRYIQSRKRKHIQSQKESQHTSSMQLLRTTPGALRFKQLVETQSMPNVEDWHLLQQSVQRLSPTFFKNVDRDAQLSEREYHVCMLVLLGFRTSDMALLMACTQQNVSNIRSRLYEKLYGRKGTPKMFDKKILDLF